MAKINIKEIELILKDTDYEGLQKFKTLYLNSDNEKIDSLIKKYENKLKKQFKEIEEYQQRKSYELYLKSQGYKYIAGIDEVGRGPLAGDVYAAAVILDLNTDIIGIKDSKKLTPTKRQELSQKIKMNAISYSFGVASIKEIDDLNILNATKVAMRRAIDGLSVAPDALLIDAVSLSNISIKQIAIIKGDDKSISIGAASIIAKVERDRYMDRMSLIYPNYMFSKNKGYGTEEHIKALKEYGSCDMHRKTFIKKFVEE